jgi:zeta-carotene isomerase
MYIQLSIINSLLFLTATQSFQFSQKISRKASSSSFAFNGCDYVATKAKKCSKPFLKFSSTVMQFYEFNNRKSMQLRSQASEMVGEDAAAFSLDKQDVKSWATFFVAVSGVLSLVIYTWIWDQGCMISMALSFANFTFLPSILGLQWGESYKNALEDLFHGDSTLTIVGMLGIFAFFHSGLASIRPFAEEIVGARPWRYVFALISLPLAFSSIVYFINHR